MCFFDSDVNCPFNCPLVSDFWSLAAETFSDSVIAALMKSISGVGWWGPVRGGVGWSGGPGSVEELHLGRHKASHCSLKISHTVELLIFLPYNKNMSTQTESATFTGRLRKHLSPPCVQRWNIWTMSSCDSTKYDNKKTLYCKKNAHDRNRGTISEPMSDDCCDAVLMKWRVQPDRVSHQCFLSARLTDLQIS